jgi:hypothetical protein
MFDMDSRRGIGDRGRTADHKRAVEKLDAVDALALLVRIEEVYAEARAGTDLETSCRDVYEKMQTRRFL